jgi:DNA-binding IclR family transcriptional regulator
VCWLIVTTEENGQHGLSVATKIFRILGAFSADRPRLRASEVCRRSGLPFSTVHRLLTELVGHEVLEHAPDGTYSVGIRLWELATPNPRLAALRRMAMPCMHDLYCAFGGSVYLDIPVGTEGLRVEELNGVDESIARPRFGTRFPLHATNGGHVLLAYAGPQAVEAYLAASQVHGGHNGADPSLGLRRTLADVRRSGVAVSESLTHLGVAAPVFGLAGSVVAAIEVLAPGTPDMCRLVAAVRSAGADLSGTAGRPRPRPSTAAPAPAPSNGHPQISKFLPTQWQPSGQRRDR